MSYFDQQLLGLHDELIVRRFWARVEKGDGCWMWVGSRQRRSDGTPSYGLAPLGRRGVRALAHRVSWEITHGAIPDGMVVCHRCDNPGCVRPDHLFLGTQAENLADMREKGRAHFNTFPVGQRHPNSRLTADDVREMRRLYEEEGVAATALGPRFGVHPTTSHNIIRRKTWRHV